jgi:hypothetical protein
VDLLCPWSQDMGGKIVHYVYPFHNFQAIGNRLATAN